MSKNSSYIPHVELMAMHVQSFHMPDGREIVIDRRAIAFCCQCKESPEAQTVIAFKAGRASPCPVTVPIAEVKSWWLGDREDVAGGPKMSAAPAAASSGGRQPMTISKATIAALLPAALTVTQPARTAP
jgi:hypothetical protein